MLCWHARGAEDLCTEEKMGWQPPWMNRASAAFYETWKGNCLEVLVSR